MTRVDSVGRAPWAADLDFYTAPGTMTDLGACPAQAFDQLPTDPAALCRVVQGLVVHEEFAAAYGVELGDERRQEVRTRPAAAMVAAILGLEPAPLARSRRAEKRMVGNCRHFSTLSTALLRRAGVAARARCGFAAYFEAGRMVDHWVTEYWSAGAGRWIRVDAQLDDLQRTLLQPSFDPDDMARGPFLPAGEAWQACRRGEADPARFGIFDMWGLWFVLGNVVRDLAALNKVELLPWDTWGPMRLRQDPDPTDGELIDTVASVVAAGDASAIRALYDGTGSLKVPAAVFDGRFGVPYQLDAAGGP